MRRCFLLLLIFVLPLQGAWAAAAPYCAHEAGMGSGAAVAGHWGHHVHEHGDEQASPAAALHADCGACHLGACHALPMSAWAQPAPSPAAAPAHSPPLPCPSHVPAGPERPDKARAAPVVRATPGAAFGPLFSA